MSKIATMVRKLIKSPSARKINRFKSLVDKVNDLESIFSKIATSDLPSKTNDFKQRLENGESLKSIMPEAFALVREGAKRTLGQRHYNVQLLGGAIINSGSIAEMRTGEGKTLVATLPAYLNALSGKGVHIVTVNDYLASRDGEWMGEIYQSLGLTTGTILSHLNEHQRRDAYQCDITYATNNELGFDYLRDNMKITLNEMVQRNHNFAIVDEVDSVLIDEARTPLIISGPSDKGSQLYTKVDKYIKKLQKDFYEIDEKMRTAIITDEGYNAIEDLMKNDGLIKGGIFNDEKSTTLVHHLNQALKANYLFKKEKDYIVHKGKVMLIDEFTGRMMEGRRYSEGLHQAIEAKERVEILPENRTLASTSFQNYFKLYTKLSGMTGTAMSEATEFADIYGIDTIELPTNRPNVRSDQQDEVYRTQKEKYQAIIKLIKECNSKEQPVLVGTTSIEKSEEVSKFLKKNKIEHRVLNARYHDQEAAIIAQAGAPKAVTIATNMAGRGTDIKLGGNLEMMLEQTITPEMNEDKIAEITQRFEKKIEQNKTKVLAAGGLYIIGTERHESRRIDNQLRGRAGRQGDPGATKFFLSLEDDLMRIFGSNRLTGMLAKLGLEKGEAIVHSWVSRAIEKAQIKVESRNFDYRKNILKYDNVLNDQRLVIFEQRIEIMKSNNIDDYLSDMYHEVINDQINHSILPKTPPELWKWDDLSANIKEILGITFNQNIFEANSLYTNKEIEDYLINKVNIALEQKYSHIESKDVNMIKKTLFLNILDEHWQDHITNLDYVRQVIGFRGYGQRDPLSEYKSEAFELFQNMLSNFRKKVCSALLSIEVNIKNTAEELQQRATPDINKLMLNEESQLPQDHGWGKVRRNAPCPCGSGKKYKMCHGKL